MAANAIDELVAHLSRLPGIGERTATRLAFYLLRTKPAFREGLASALGRLSEIHLCSVCSTVTEADPCSICSSHVRNKETICIVEKPSDIYSIERMHSYQGLYHVIHGLISPMEGVAPSDLRIPQLLERISTNPPSEVILALSPTVEGDATNSYLAKQLHMKAPEIKISRLASGLPIGSDLEYADQITLGKAFEARIQVV
jgi:recombination protein RecR